MAAAANSSSRSHHGWRGALFYWGIHSMSYLDMIPGRFWETVPKYQQQLSVSMYAQRRRHPCGPAQLHCVDFYRLCHFYSV